MKFPNLNIGRGDDEEENERGPEDVGSVRHGLDLTSRRGGGV